MAPKKKVSGLIKLQIQAGKANPAPPLGPALGSHGVNIMDFCKAYNAQTQDKMGQVIPVEITVYEDRSFTFVLKTPPAAALLKKAAGVEKGTENPLTHKVGSVTKAQVRKAYEDFYQDEYFVRLLPDGMNADIHNIKYSNFCDISLHIDTRCGNLIAISAIDNMVKGAAGQAIQNMNLIFGLEEASGLALVPPAF